MHNPVSGQVTLTRSQISGVSNRHRHAKPVEGIQDHAVHMHLGYLLLRLTSSQSFAQLFETPHGGFD